MTATTRATPRIAWSAAATDAIDQVGISSSICRVSRSRLHSASLDSMDLVLQHDLLRRMIKVHRGEPAGRTCAFQAMSLIAADSGSRRS